MTNPINIPTPPRLTTAAKTLAATFTTAAGFLGLVVNAVADGGVSSGELGELLIGALTAGAAIYAVWRVPNTPV